MRPITRRILRFVFEREPVAGLGFDGGGPSGVEPGNVPAGSGQELVFGRGARLANGGADAAASGCDLGVARALDALLELSGAVPGKYRMRVRVHESRHHDALAGVDDRIMLSDAWLDFARVFQPERCGRLRSAWRHRR